LLPLMAAATAVGTLSFPLSNFRLLQLEENTNSFPSFFFSFSFSFYFFFYFFLQPRFDQFSFETFTKVSKSPWPILPAQPRRSTTDIHGADSTRNLHTATAETMHERNLTHGTNNYLSRKHESSPQPSQIFPVLPVNHEARGRNSTTG
jgi:hypothetical protein